MAGRGAPKGRPKPIGSGRQPNDKKREKVSEMLKRHSCDPHEELLFIARKAYELGDLAVSSSCYKELCMYVSPKLRSVEHSGEINGQQVIYLDSIDKKL